MRAAAAVGVALDFERHSGSADACAELLTQAGFADARVLVLPIADAHTVADAKAALERSLANPLCAELARAAAADAALAARLRGAYDALVEGAAGADGRLHTDGRCFVAVGRAA